MKPSYTITTDVFIVGMGGAGIRAAIAASDAGAHVTLAGKCRFGTSGATFYPGTPGWGMQAVIHEGDTEEYFLEEILEAGNGAANPAVSSVLAHEATDRFHDLEAMGLVFGHNEDGTYRGVIPCFGKRLRGSSTLGIEKIRRTMWRQLRKRDVDILEKTAVIRLLKEDGRITGALCVDALGEIFAVRAGAVILATGGGCGIYAYSLATPDETGDGYQLALDAGARLVNMEFVQFIPGLTSPVKKLLFQEKNLITFPTFSNKDGEDILAKHLPDGITKEACLTERAKHGPFTTEDISFWLDLAMTEEAVAGNAFPDGGIQVTYDPAIAEDERWIITDWLSWMHSRNIYPERDGFRMIPHAQCFNGGIEINAKAETGIPGLYAAGECAGGAHGADRLGGAAIAATQVFGKIAGEEAARFAIYGPEISDTGNAASSELGSESGSGKGTGVDADMGTEAETGAGTAACAEAAGGENGMDPGARLRERSRVMETIRGIMWEDAAIVRSEDRCADGLTRLAALKTESGGLLVFREGEEKEVSELRSYFTLAEVMLTVMRERRESRGPHYRSDYPEKDPAMRGSITVRKEDGKLKTEWVFYVVSAKR